MANEYILRTIPISEIESIDRSRTELGDLDELVNSFKKYGIIQSLAVATKQDGDGGTPYRLLAGGRRYAAAIQAGIELVPVKIYTEELSEMHMKSIELEENLRRKDLTFIEKCRLTREINDLQVALYGRKISTSPDAPGHSMRDTADMLNVSPMTVVNDIKLATAMEQFPDLDWGGCKNQSEALKVLAKFEERVVRADLSSRASELMKSSKTKKIIDSYILGDFFEKVKGVPNNSIDLVEIDPPYGIDLPNMKKEHNSNYGDSYNEVDASIYIKFIGDTLTESYRIMKEDSWLIFWFGPEPWFDIIYSLIKQSGFETRRLCGIWTKNNGQTKHPDIYLAQAYEMFYYARKGNAVINLDKRGRGNIFDFSPVSPTNKIHPTERPVPLMEEILRTFTWEGSRVIVPFAGSGNTLRAAYNLNMFPLGYDLSKEYKDSFTVRVLNEEKGEN
jgi:site-specific DNA-methyltransferase (adenine-specific)